MARPEASSPNAGGASVVRWRVIALPTEHGGWGLTVEPVLLGLLVAPAWAGACLGIGAVLAFLARTPLRIVLVDTWRGRRLERTRHAAGLLAAESVVLVVLVVAAAVVADGGHWWRPLLVMVPLVAVELWFDMRSRSRRLVPELAGAIGIAGVVAMIVLADDGESSLAAALWLVLAARACTSIPFVRGQIARLHSRPGGTTRRATAMGDLVAVIAGAVAIGLEPEVLAGVVAVVAVVVVQRVIAAGAARPAKVLGIQQTALGLVVVLATAVGVVT